MPFSWTECCNQHDDSKTFHVFVGREMSFVDVACLSTHMYTRRWVGDTLLHLGNHEILFYPRATACPIRHDEFLPAAGSRWDLMIRVEVKGWVEAEDLAMQNSMHEPRETFDHESRYLEILLISIHIYFKRG